MDAPALLDELQGIPDHRERLEPEKVELRETRRREIVHGELGHDVFVGALAQGHPLDERPVRDDDTRRMGRGMTVEALQGARKGQQAAYLLVLLLLFLEAGLLLDGLLERDVEDVGDQLGDAVHLPVRHVQGPAHVPDDGLGLHLSEGDDLRHAVAAVLLRDVADDLVAALHAEIGVDVGHALAVRIEEAFEEQAVSDRVDLGDPDGVGHQAARRGSAPGTHRNISAFRVVDEVRDDEEVSGEAHGLDDVKLPGQALLVRLPQRRVPVLQDLRHEPLEPGPGHFLEVLVQRLPLADLEVRQVNLLKIEGEVALLGDHHRVRDGLGAVRKELLHFVGRLEIEGVRGKTHAAGILHGLARLDAQQDLVGLVVGALEVVAVVGRHERDGQFLRDGHQLFVHDRLLGNPVLHHLQVVIALAEDVPVLLCGGPRPLQVTLEDPVGDLAVQTGARGDEPLAVRGQQLLVDSRTVVKAFQKSRRGELHQVPVALEVLDQDDEMAGRLSRALRGLVEPALRGHVELAADDGLDPRLVGLLVEVDGTVHVAVVGDGHGGHPEFLGLFEEVAEADGAVQEAVLGVEVEMDEIDVLHDVLSA